ncbi:MAG: hypothetical protein HY903_11795 [Deltaproteobacteria bacterium]|nr:hypothetical protein [Deltaproteobacteria bacterium]
MHQLSLWGPSKVETVAATAACSPAASVPRIDLSRPELFTDWLQARLGRPVKLTFTDNRSTFVSCRVRRGVLQLRLHRLFAAAAEAEVRAIAGYLNDEPGASRLLDDFIANHRTPAERRPAATPVLAQGRCHDLREIWTEVNDRFFHGASQAQITWGHSGSRRYRRTIQLGCYVADLSLIRVHPCLDQPFVPRQYVAWIVFHEMLHEVLGTERRRARRRVHPPEFSALEQTFPGFAACKEWERDNLHRLLRFRKR